MNGSPERPDVLGDLPPVRADRRRAVLIFAAVLGLNGADQATSSATANNLERAFHLGNTGIGLLVTVVGLAGAAFTAPVGVLTDRTQRTRLLAVSIAGWAAATGFSGMAQSYTWMLIARVALGAVSATAGPTVASLVGDFFPPAERGRMYGLIIGGELAGIPRDVATAAASLRATAEAKSAGEQRGTQRKPA